MLKRIYYRLHRYMADPQEKGEYSSGYWQSRVRKEALQRCTARTGRILEIGCGEGLFLRDLARLLPEAQLYGIDSESARLKKAASMAQEEHLPNITLLQQRAPLLAFGDNFFDVVFCINVFFNLASLAEVAQTLTTMHRVCKQSGKIIFDFRNGANPLLRLKYWLAPYYDGTVKHIHLTALTAPQIQGILRDLHVQVLCEKPIGWPLLWLAPVILMEAGKP